MKILLTGAAGFIGMHVGLALLKRGAAVVGIDNLNSYYSVQLKRDRLAQFQDYQHFYFHQCDLQNREALRTLFQKFHFDIVIHLAAQAGVRYSLEAPQSYIDSNVTGFLTVLELCREFPVKHLLYASSSSVYGINQDMPWQEEQSINHPLSLYAATKVANESMAHAYSHLFNIPTTGLRFFTVYGPWGRPDMAYFKFAKAMLSGQPITVFHEGQMYRDFTFIDDIVFAILALIDKQPAENKEFSAFHPDPATSQAPWRVLNVGHEQPVLLMDMINELETLFAIKAVINWQPFQPGDVIATSSSNQRLRQIVGEIPKTNLRDGLKSFANWMQDWREA